MHPGIENAARWGPEAALEGAEKEILQKSIIHEFPVPPRNRTGIPIDCRQRTPDEAFRAIRPALDGEVWLASKTVVHTAPEMLEDISAWTGRGYLPS